jgi:hypothetical protein
LTIPFLPAWAAMPFRRAAMAALPPESAAGGGRQAAVHAIVTPTFRFIHDKQQHA